MIDEDYNDPAELLAVVDTADVEIRGERRDVVHATGLLHRAVHVFIFGRDGRLLLQQRSELKDTYPLHWECVGGHLAPGEDYDSAAAREVQEELGVPALKLRFVRKLEACAETGQEFIQVYTAALEREPAPHPEEVVGLCWFTREELRREVSSAARMFSPSLLHSIHCIGLLDDAGRELWNREKSGAPDES
jgi:isopentenyl-diphosphate delta-isomerase type 1